MADLPAVVHVSSARTWRGGEQQAAYLHGQLAALGAPQVLVCPRGSAFERVARERGLRHAAPARRASVDPLFARTVARAVAELHADVVHAHDPHAHTAAVLAASLFGMRAPIVIHRRVDFRIGGDPFTRWKYDHRSVRRILCVSRCIADVLRPAIARPERLRVVHSSIDRGRFGRERADGRLRREYGVPATVPVVGNVSALAPHKDHLTFVETAARLREEGVDARLFAIGEGEERAAVAARIRERGLERNVVLTGFRRDIPELLAELDVFLITSTTEGLGTSILDAFAAGTPVVATAAGGIPEIVVDGETGLLAPVGDAAALARCVRRVLEDRALRARLVEGAGRSLQEYSVERMAERTLGIYREAIDEHRAASRYL